MSVTSCLVGIMHAAMPLTHAIVIPTLIDQLCYYCMNAFEFNFKVEWSCTIS